MKRLFAIFIAIFAVTTAMAQSEKSIVIEQQSFRPVQTDALTGVNIDPIGLDHSKRPCARLKVRINRMTKEDINALQVKIITNNQLTKNKTAEYDNGLILELTAKPQTRFYFQHDLLGYSNEVCLDLEADKEYRLVAHDVAPGKHILRVEYSGKTNEQIVKSVADWQTKYPAFAWCAKLGEGWYLPAINEVKKLTLDQTVHAMVNKTLAERGGTRLYNSGEEAQYWSSTEYSKVYAWGILMHSGYSGGFFKNHSRVVRAVAAF